MTVQPAFVSALVGMHKDQRECSRLDNARRLGLECLVQDAGHVDQQREFGVICLNLCGKSNPKLRPQL
jgi:hypothetical protein